MAGDGWTLTARELRFTTEGAVDVLPLDRLAACQEVDSVVCAWAAGVAEPVFRRPSGTPNALLLLALLEHSASSATPSPAVTPAPAVWGEPADAGLGRLLSERNTAGDDRQMATVLAVAMVAGAGYGWWMVGKGLAGFELHLLAYGGPLAAVAAAVHAWRNRVNLFQHFAGGVAHTTARGTRYVRFADLRGVRLRRHRPLLPRVVHPDTGGHDLRAGFPVHGPGERAGRHAGGGTGAGDWRR